MKQIISMLLSCVLFFGVSISVSAEEPTQVCSTELVVIINALFDKIEYDTAWLDINSDGNLDIIDLICLKKYVAGVEQNSYKPIKSITVTYKYTDRTETVKQYTSKCVLPELSGGFWKNGTSYYNPRLETEAVVYRDTDTTFTYSKTKGIDTPIIPLG